MIVIVNYGVGNVNSILNMLKKIGVEAKLSESTQDVLSADKLILPGVGSFDYGMRRLEESGYKDAIIKYATEYKRPLLGICLGMQMLGDSSEEGNEKGLGLISFKNIKFKFDGNELKVPHMGWNLINTKYKDNPLSKQFDDEYRFYFVHSYHAAQIKDENILFTCNYGIDFAAGVISGNIMGVQFHPEKSHHYGMQLLKNFSEISNV